VTGASADCGELCRRAAVTFTAAVTAVLLRMAGLLDSNRHYLFQLRTENTSRQDFQLSLLPATSALCQTTPEIISNFQFFAFKENGSFHIKKLDLAGLGY